MSTSGSNETNESSPKVNKLQPGCHQHPGSLAATEAVLEQIPSIHRIGFQPQLHPNVLLALREFLFHQHQRLVRGFVRAARRKSAADMTTAAACATPLVGYDTTPTVAVMASVGWSPHIALQICELLVQDQSSRPKKDNTFITPMTNHLLLEWVPRIRFRATGLGMTCSSLDAPSPTFQHHPRNQPNQLNLSLQDCFSATPDKHPFSRPVHHQR